MKTKCNHELHEMETAAAWDGLCPICLKEEVDSLRKRITELENKIRRHSNPMSETQWLNGIRKRLLQSKI